MILTISNIKQPINQKKSFMRYSPSKDQDNLMLEFSGETLIYPCISWCNAEQKSVQ